MFVPNDLADRLRNDLDDLSERLETQRVHFEERERRLRARVDRLVDALAGIYAVTYPLSDRLGWEDTQEEYNARGRDAELLADIKRRRAALAQSARLAGSALHLCGIKPSDVETESAAAARRQREEYRSRAAELRAEADRLDREFGGRGV